MLSRCFDAFPTPLSFVRSIPKPFSFFAYLFAVLVGLLLSSTARADSIFVTNFLGTGSLANTIGDYTTSGATVNSSLISGLNNPTGIAVSGSNLFVTNYAGGTVGCPALRRRTLAG